MNSAGTAAVEVVDVSRSAAGTPILDGVSFAAEAGRWTWIVGASGSGKSSLLRLINRLDDPDAGQVLVDGHPTTEWSPLELRRRVGWVPQSPAVADMTGAQLLAEACDIGELSAVDAERRTPEALSLAELGPELLARPMRALSGGERHRLALARAVLLGPSVLLLDEPTASLDAETAGRVLASLDRWREAYGKTLIAVTHRQAEAAALGGRTVTLEKGRVLR